jgi:cell division protein FtsQ
VVLLLVLLVAGAVAAGRFALLHMARFQVSEIEVYGAAEPRAAQVRLATGVTAGTALLAVDTDAAARRVSAVVPQVGRVEVTRGWPGTLTVTVTERTAVAVAASGTGPMLVDATGLAYEPAGRPPPALPRLAVARVAPGDPGTSAALATLAALPPSVRQRVEVVEVSGPSSVTLRLAGGKQVRWGSPDDSARKAAVLEVLLSQRGDSYDVSAPDLPTVRR